MYFYPNNFFLFFIEMFSFFVYFFYRNIFLLFYRNTFYCLFCGNTSFFSKLHSRGLVVKYVRHN